MAKRGFTLSEMIIVLVIIGVVSAVTIPLISVKKKVGSFEANILKCVRTEIAADLASAACAAAIQKAQFGQEKAITHFLIL